MSSAWTLLVQALAWLPLQLVRLLRRWQLGTRRLVELRLTHVAPRRPTADLSLDTLAVVDALRLDPMVRGVLLDLHGVQFGTATLQALHAALLTLRAAGKLVAVHLDAAGNNELVLASAADRVWMTPSGQVDLFAPAARLTFFARALRRVGITVDLEAAGAYKSFGEPYTRDWASSPNREAMTSLVDDLHRQLVETIASGRRIDPEKVEEALRQSPLDPTDALALGLIDGVAYPDQVRTELEALLSVPCRPLSFLAYSRLARLERWLQRLGQPSPAVVVVSLAGPILHTAEGIGGGRRRIDAGQVVPALDRLRERDDVRAVVLYVDSPGGSALGSDLIARAVQRLASAKPVVAVFGDVSASGGYYLSAPAAELIARPGTITGSIGVVGGKVVVGAGLAQLGVASEVVGGGANSGFYGPWEPFTDGQRERFRLSLSRTYDRFLAVVAAGRRCPVAAIRPHAEGRVWTGAQALERGLIDRLGGLDDGIRRARTLAGLDPDVRDVVHLRFPTARLLALSSLLSRSAAPAASTDLLSLLLRAGGQAGAMVDLVRQMPNQPLALLPWTFEDA